jgi:hypothetical protein
MKPWSAEAVGNTSMENPYRRETAVFPLKSAVAMLEMLNA